jgi:hypothetical protein
MRAQATVIVAAVLLLAGCGDLPRPFMGRPGATALRLAQPPPPRLAVPAPAAALLPDGASRAYAEAVVAALQAREVPAEAGAAEKGDWRLVITAELHGDKVVPSFAVEDPAGKPQGSTDGPPMDAAAWSQGAPEAMRAAGTAAGPAIATLLTRIEAVRRQSDPNSLLNRPPRVVVNDVTGAPGNGNRELTRQMRRLLPELGEMVQDKPEGADFAVTGQVVTAPAAPGNLRVEVSWTVNDAQGRELGKVVQLNEVPKGTLDGLWGDVALVVAQQAAEGVRSVMDRATGPRPSAAGAAAPPAKP